MTASVFIDGQAGSTGLEIAARLQNRDGLELIQIEPSLRKEKNARAECINNSDVSILCLPDNAARETLELVKNPKVKLIDASSAHRISKDWVYGFAECAPGQRTLISDAQRISNPGCYASGSIALLAPLVRTGLIPPEHPINIYGISGYSGGGKNMIAEFENQTDTPVFRLYSLDTEHKHIPEITRHAHLHHKPVLIPAVGAFPRGMIVNIPLHTCSLPANTSPEDLHDTLKDAYFDEPMIHVSTDHPNTLSPEIKCPSDRLDIYVSGHQKHILLTAHLDNLGKGAAGAAVQNLNLALGLPEQDGLRLPVEKNSAAENMPS